MLQQPRAILRSPYKVLDAPELQDDFYLNLVDWSATNILAVGLGACVYLWNAQSSVVTKLCDLVRPNAAPDSTGNDTVTGVGWNPRGNYLAVGTSKGVVEVWDVEAKRRLHELTGNTSRVGSIAWRGDVLTTGSRDRSITLRDIRCPQSETKLSVHKQEVCGLKWNYDETLLASGGNDNKLLIWDRKMLRKPVLTYSEHTAAVKAIAWSPHKNGLLASGGGTADQYIRFWNVTSPATDSLEQKMTNSQVCNIAWSKSDDEIKPSLTHLETLTGHTMRVLYLAISPDNQNIVTGAGDETLRFWHVFRKERRAYGAGSDSAERSLAGIDTTHMLPSLR
ncbi:substrate-specific activator of APC-dependent proteolysis [Entophlyctis luteolus]|nr:substrate-specific activator of APC-dependent proteolysis [Entophlyctis luteolus]